MRDYKCVSVGSTCYDIVVNGSQSEQASFNCTFTGQYHKEDGTTAPVTVPMPSTEVLKMLGDFWGSYKLLVQKDFAGTRTDRDLLSESFATWHSHNSENLSRIYDAFYSQYNPIDNYNGRETTSEDYGDTANPFVRTKTISGKVKSGSKVDSFTRAGGLTAGTTIEEDTYGDSEGRHSETTFDDTTSFKPVSKDEAKAQGGHSRTEGSANDNYTEWEDYEERSTEEGSKTTHLEKSGNLGVTTSQSMVEAELALRKHDIFYEYLQSYAHECLSLIDEESYLMTEGL